jgi:hypothetical protein
MLLTLGPWKEGLWPRSAHGVWEEMGEGFWMSPPWEAEWHSRDWRSPLPSLEAVLGEYDAVLCGCHPGTRRSVEKPSWVWMALSSWIYTPGSIYCQVSTLEVMTFLLLMLLLVHHACIFEAKRHCNCYSQEETKNCDFLSHVALSILEVKAKGETSWIANLFLSPEEHLRKFQAFCPWIPCLTLNFYMEVYERNTKIQNC